MTGKSVNLADVIEPEIFAQYTMDDTTEKSEIVNAGVVENNAQLDVYVASGGTIFTAPSWNDLEGESQVMDDANPIATSKISAKGEMIVKIIRAFGFRAHDLASNIAGSNAFNEMRARLSDFWVRDEKRTIISILNGVFGDWSDAKIMKEGRDNPMKEHVLDCSSSNISGGVILDGKQLLGDNAGLLSKLYMHSASYTELQKQNLIQYVTVEGPNGSKIDIPSYLGYSVVTDDSAPVNVVGGTKGVHTLTISTALASGDYVIINGKIYRYNAEKTTAAAQAADIAAMFADDDKFDVSASTNKVVFTQKNAGIGRMYAKTDGVASGSAAMAETTAAVAGTRIYSSYLLASGAIQRGSGVPEGFVPIDIERDGKMSSNDLYSRQAKILHPKGISFVGAAEMLKPTPSNEELANGDFWTLSKEHKKIGMVKILHKVGA